MKPKTFGPVFVRFDGCEGVEFAHTDPADLNARPPLVTPVDTLLASLGHCIAVSVKWAADQKKTTLNPFTVAVVGNKALDPPNRLAAVDVMIIGKIVDEPELAELLLKRAKAICTVSNSLNCNVTVGIRK